MSIGLIGTKLGMTREFIQSGQSVPVTVIKIEKGRVIDIIQKDSKTKPIYEYMQRVFTKPCFINSLSELERDIRSA